MREQSWKWKKMIKIAVHNCCQLTEQLPTATSTLWHLQCYQSIETNIGDHFYARTKLKLANRALWVARESSEEDPMTFIFDEILNLCEPEKFGESFASCRPATEEKKAGSRNLYSISNYLLQMCFVDLWIIPLWINPWFINPQNTLGVNSCWDFSSINFLILPFFLSCRSATGGALAKFFRFTQI